MTISGCNIHNYEVGILLSPSNQQNGELIYVNDNEIDNCKVAYATTQAQAKGNKVTDLKVWGGVHTIFDGTNYGFYHGDGSCFPSNT